MFDTYVTIVGNVLTAPEWRRTTQSNTLVANFKVASTARRLDRDSGRWVDGNSLRVRVNCWRKLAEGVAASIMVGDPVVVCGRLYTRDWTDDAGNHRTLYELEAVAVGHDLSRGRGRFLRNRPTMSTSTVQDAEAEQRVHGEPTEPVPDGDAPAVLDDGPLDEDFELSGFPVRGRRELSPFAGATDPFDEDADELADGAGAAELRWDGTDASGAADRSDGSAEGDTSVEGDASGGAGGSDGPGDDLDPVPDSGAAGSSTGRGRRSRGRVPQPA
ncbi:single-stranded DNA-binding protein [Micromonospora sp. BQ11]|uniref:single-stranded DNA-binding protein n=1 Tax=Micromonospora sp. BQ11 TaxID=3452212 RepID=UPI003F8C5674